MGWLNKRAVSNLFPSSPTGHLPVRAPGHLLPDGRHQPGQGAQGGHEPGAAQLREERRESGELVGGV